LRIGHFALNFAVPLYPDSTERMPDPFRRAPTVRPEMMKKKCEARFPGKFEGEKEMTLTRKRVWSQVCAPRLALVLGLLVAALFAGVGSAQACSQSKDGAPAMPWMQDQDSSNWQPSIVGLWHVVYTQSDGSPFNQTFKMWHSDGIEFENAILPPGGGDICYGVWKQTGSRSVKLHHIGVMWAPDGTIAGTFTVDETNTVSEDGKSYTGKFTFSQFKPNGDAGPVITGTTAAKRVTFKTPSTEVD
jgi:hypothetical protein